MKKTIILLLGCMLSLGMQARSFVLQRDSIPADTLRTDSLSNDSVKSKKAEPKKETEYEKLLKKDSTYRDGLFRVRHIEDKYYFEVPDSMLGRMVLCVTRFTGVPQQLGQFAGEEINHSTVYFEQRDTTSLILRQYVQSHLSAPADQITRTLEQSTVNPMVAAFKVIGRNPEKDASLIEVTPIF